LFRRATGAINALLIQPGFKFGYFFLQIGSLLGKRPLSKNL